jgi:hypothetical protein
MKRLLLAAATLAAFAPGAAATLAVLAPSAARATEPPTVFGQGAFDSFIDGANAYDNQAWWGAQDLHGKAKLFISFNTTPSNLGIPVTHLLVIGVTPAGRDFLGVWPASFKITSDPPAITSPYGSVTWVPSKSEYHLTVNVPGAFVFTPLPGPFSANLWFKGVPGAAAMPTYWDSQTSYLPQTIGAGTATGTIDYPGVRKVTVAGWGADAEPEYGTYLDGTPAYSPADHIGFEWAEAQNPDGSADLLMAFAEEDGVWRGMLSQTTASGQVTECEPDVTLSNWTQKTGQLPPNVTGFEYPQAITATCPSPPPQPPCLSMTWYPSPAGTQIGPFVTYSFTVAMGAASTSVPGAVAWYQDFREKGSDGRVPTFTSTGLPPKCVVLPAPGASARSPLP